MLKAVLIGFISVMVYDRPGVSALDTRGYRRCPTEVCCFCCVSLVVSSQHVS